MPSEDLLEPLRPCLGHLRFAGTDSPTVPVRIVADLLQVPGARYLDGDEIAAIKRVTKER
jgi:hypothetical protein